MKKLGKTNDFPRGKLNATDEGGLNIGIVVRDKTVVLAFGAPVAWFGMDKETALKLGNSIIEKANSI